MIKRCKLCKNIVFLLKNKRFTLMYDERRHIQRLKASFFHRTVNAIGLKIERDVPKISAPQRRCMRTNPQYASEI